MKLHLWYLIPFVCLTQQVGAQCNMPTAQVDISVNNVRARILNGGDLWWDPVSQINYYEIPKGSGLNALYAGAIWFGGIDATGQIKVAAQTYRQNAATDYWTGPLSKSPTTGAASITQSICMQYDQLYAITRAEVLAFSQGGPATTAIQQWPGNGNVALNQLPYLAPFFDANNDGVYDYNAGDYPYFNLSGTFATNPTTGHLDCNDYLFGDKTIWWVFNDEGNIKTESNSAAIGLEIRAQAFEFQSADPDINNSSFYKYQIINRSSDSLLNTYMGVWADPDLGNAADDYVGCDVSRGLGYVYNGDANDNGTGGYGLYPPALGIDFFQGPLADLNDGIDNNRNGIVDEPGEQIMMTHFMYYHNTNNVVTGNPNYTADYYSYLKGQWLDSASVTYGGDGRGALTGATTVPCNFMFPDNSDTAFTTPWTMATAGIQPTDMRFLMSAGKFTLAPGAVNYVCFGVVWSRDSIASAQPSVLSLKTADTKIQSLFDNCFTTATGINEHNPVAGISVYPNPTNNSCTVNLPAGYKNGTVDVKIYSISGTLCGMEKNLQDGTTIHAMSQLQSGVYILHFNSKGQSSSVRVVKY